MQRWRAGLCIQAEAGANVYVVESTAFLPIVALYRMKQRCATSVVCESDNNERHCEHPLYHTGPWLLTYQGLVGTVDFHNAEFNHASSLAFVCYS